MKYEGSLKSTVTHTRCKILLHPPYGHNLVLSDYHLFGPVKHLSHTSCQMTVTVRSTLS
jgi:hypothetical protein